MAEGANVSAGGAADVTRFGEQPLAQTMAAAGAVRRLTGLLLSLEQQHPLVDVMLAQFEDWERELTAAVPPDAAPRIGLDSGTDRRVYLSHAFDIGAFNPCFPEYEFDHLDVEKASGRVTFPLVYEGPPGLVHGGFLGVFFDCVIQHQSCAAQLSGRTRSLLVKFRRPTPVETELRFEIARSEEERGIQSTARLLRDGEVLCTGEVSTVASPPEKLTGYRFGRRQASREELQR